MRVLCTLTLAGTVAVLGGCLEPPDPGTSAQALDSAGDLKGPAMFAEAFGDAFSAAGASIVYVKDGSTAAWSAIPASQSFAPLTFAAPDGSGRDRIVGYTAPEYAVKSGTALAGITLTTSAAQQLICPASGSCATSVGGVTPSLVVVPDVADSADSVLHDMCASRPLCTGIVLVADGPVGHQVTSNGGLTSFALTGIGKPCASGDSQPVCLAKFAATNGTFALGDSRIALGTGITELALDGVAPTAANIRGATYPGARQLHLIDKTDTDTRVQKWWLWFDGDGTLAHPDHYASWATTLTTRGFVPLSGSPIVVTP